MQLTEIEVENFRSLKNLNLPFHDLTVLIGENDAGKSSILDAIDIFLNRKNPDFDDYYQPMKSKDKRAESISIILTFELDNWDKESEYSLDNKITVKKVYSESHPNKVFYMGNKFVDDSLNTDFTSLSADEQRGFLSNFDITEENDFDLSNQEKRIDELNKYKNNAETRQDWIEIRAREIQDILPRFQRYSAIDYTEPDGIVRNTMQTLYESMLFVEEGDSRSLIDSFKDFQEEFRAKATARVNDLKTEFQKYKHDITDVSYDPQIDFTRGFRGGEFLINSGRGLHRLGKMGDGTKRRILMGTMDWSNRVISEDVHGITVIRAYDEPDTNLHYHAQKEMFDAVTKATGVRPDNEVRIQTVVCTHSLPMIDRAPASKINSLKLEQGCTISERLITDKDEDIKDFLDNVARDLGITNTTLFFERCYIIIEGQTEEIAIPILCRKLYGNSLIDDGIRLINAFGYSAWLSLLRWLGRTRHDVTLAIFDSDSKREMQKKFYEHGKFTPSTFEDQTYWIGEMEFEDEFSDLVIMEAFNQRWSDHKSEFLVENISAIRSRCKKERAKGNRGKFSEELQSYVQELIDEKPSKPDIGECIANYIDEEDIPATIIELFEHARAISGVNYK